MTTTTTIIITIGTTAEAATDRSQQMAEGQVKGKGERGVATAIAHATTTSTVMLRTLAAAQPVQPLALRHPKARCMTRISTAATIITTTTTTTATATGAAAQVQPTCSHTQPHTQRCGQLVRRTRALEVVVEVLPVGRTLLSTQQPSVAIRPQVPGSCSAQERVWAAPA